MFHNRTKPAQAKAGCGSVVTRLSNHWKIQQQQKENQLSDGRRYCASDFDVFVDGRGSFLPGSTRPRDRSDGLTNVSARWNMCPSVQVATRTQPSAPPQTPSPPPLPMLLPTAPTLPLPLAPRPMTSTMGGLGGFTALSTSASCSMPRPPSAPRTPPQVCT